MLKLDKPWYWWREKPFLRVDVRAWVFRRVLKRTEAVHSYHGSHPFTKKLPKQIRIQGKGDTLRKRSEKVYTPLQEPLLALRVGPECAHVRA